MSFSLKTFQGDAEKVVTDLERDFDHSREQEVLDELKTAIENVVHKLGGYVSVSAQGHINPAPGETGDTINLSIASLPIPAGPSPKVDAPVDEVDPNAGFMDTADALAQSSSQNRPGGTVAPPSDTTLPVGLTTSPVTEGKVDQDDLDEDAEHVEVVDPPEQASTTVVDHEDSSNDSEQAVDVIAKEDAAPAVVSAVIGEPPVDPQP